MKVNWEDLRCFVAVVESGSLTSAAKKLEISQPTVGRKIKELERTLDSPMLQREQDHYQTTEFGQSIYLLARQMRDKAWAIECKAQEDTCNLQGSVKIATTDCLAVSWFSKQLPEMAVLFPQVDVELAIGLDLMNLAQRQADIAVRIGSRGSEELIGERMATVSVGLFASQGYLTKQGLPQALTELDNHHIIESLGGLSNVVQVNALRDAAPNARRSMGSDSLLTQAQAAAEGLGIVSLPIYLAQQHTSLVRILQTEFDMNLDLWLLIHNDLLTSVTFKAIYNHLRNSILRDANLFTADLSVN